MQKAKRYLFAIATIVAVIIAFQNHETVETKLLFATLTMPRSVLILVTFLVGATTGFLFGSRGRRDKA